MPDSIKSAVHTLKKYNGDLIMLERLKEVIARVVPDIDAEGVTEDTKLVEDLGFDSLAMMMMSMEIEDRFGFKFTEFVRFVTVGDVCKYVAEKATK